jgi:hypothetical protein
VTTATVAVVRSELDEIAERHRQDVPHSWDHMEGLAEGLSLVFNSCGDPDTCKAGVKDHSGLYLTKDKHLVGLGRDPIFGFTTKTFWVSLT